MRQPDLFFSDANCEIRVSGDVAVVHDRAQSRYFRTRAADLPVDVRVALREQHLRVTTPIASLVTAGVVVGWLALLFATSDQARPGQGVLLPVALVLAVSIAIHEIGHVLVLRAFGRRIDRVGVKLNHWVFPAMYVRMSQSIMLTRPQQALVHLGGVGANVGTLALAAGCDAFLWHTGWLTTAVHVTVVLLGWNLLPLLGSDGYRVLLAFCRTDAARGLRSNPVWLNLLRLASVLAAVAAVAHLFFVLLG